MASPAVVSLDVDKAAAIQGLRAIQTGIKTLRNEVTGLNRDVRNLNRAFLGKEAKQAEKGLKGVESGVKRVRRETTKSGKGVEGFKGKLFILSRTANVAVGPLSEVAARITAIGSIATKGGFLLAGFIGSLVAFGAIAFKTSKVALEFERGLFEIAKNTGILGADLRVLGQRLRAIAIDFSTPRKEILAIADAAGRLGVKGIENIERFTQTVAQLVLTTSLGGQEAATNIARLIRVTKGSISDIEGLGSAIVKLGSSFAATEKEVLEAGLEVARATAPFGVAAGEALAFGAALAEAGVRTEAGGTAIGLVMIQIQKALGSTGLQAKQLEIVFGKSIEEIRRLFEEDALEATIQFVEGIGRLERAGLSSISVLSEFGIVQKRVLKAINPFIQGTERLREAVKSQNEELKTAAEITKQTEIRLSSAPEALNRLKESFADVAIEIGDQFLPLIVDVADELRELISLFDIGAGRVELLGRELSKLVDKGSDDILGFRTTNGIGRSIVDFFRGDFSTDFAGREIEKGSPLDKVREFFRRDNKEEQRELQRLIGKFLQPDLSFLKSKADLRQFRVVGRGLIDELTTENILGLSPESLRQQVDFIEQQMARASAAFEKVETSIKSLKDVGGLGKNFLSGIRDLKDRVFESAFGGKDKANFPFRPAKDFINDFNNLQQVLQNIRKGGALATTAAIRLTENIQKAREEIEKLDKNNLDQVVKRLTEMKILSEEFFKKYDDGNISVEDTKQLIAELQGELKTSVELAEIQVARIESLFRRTFEGLQKTFSDTLFQIFRGSKNRNIVTQFIDFIRDSFARLAADLLTLQVAAPFLAPVFLGASSLFFPDNSAQAQAAVANSLGIDVGDVALLSASGFGKTATSFFSKIGTSLGFNNSAIGAKVSQAIPGGSPLQNATFGQFLGAGFLGAGLGGFGANILGLGQTGGSIGGGLGAAIGTLIPGLGPVLGGLIGGLSGGILGKVFSKTPKSFATISTSGLQGVGKRGKGDIGVARGLGDQVLASLGSIASSIGASLASDFTIGQIGRRKNRFVFTTDPTTGKAFGKKGSFQSFSTPEEAVAAAIRAAFVGGAFTDLTPEQKSALSNLLDRSIDEIVSGLQLATKLTDLFNQFAEEGLSPLERAIADLNEQFDDAADSAKELGLNVEKVETAREASLLRVQLDFAKGIQQSILRIVDPLKAELRALEEAQKQRLKDAQAIGFDIAAIEKLNLLEREKLISEFGDRTNSVLRDFLISLTAAPGAALPPEIAISNASSRFSRLRSQFLGGNTSVASQLVQAGENLLGLRRAQDASGPGFFETAAFITRTIEDVLQIQEQDEQLLVLQDIAEFIQVGNDKLDALISLFSGLSNLSEEGAGASSSSGDPFSPIGGGGSGTGGFSFEPGGVRLA